MLNRVIPGAIAMCLVAAMPSGAVLGATHQKKGQTPVLVLARPAPERAVAAARKTTAATGLAVGAAINIDKAAEAGVSREVLTLALQATSCAARSGEIDPPPTLTLIDYSRPSVEPRLWTFDLSTGEILFKELVAHGKNTGDNFAKQFSNEMNSRQSSIGLFVTEQPYVGSNGYSLRLDGLDVGFNDRARDRAIVMHGAPYVSQDLAARQGRIGRSWGCPALRPAVASKVIDRIRGGSVIFSYYPNQDWLTSSRFLKACSAGLTALRDGADGT